MATPYEFRYLAKSMFGRAKQFRQFCNETKFRALFGVTPEICTNIWDEIMDTVPPGGKPIHLMWALLFLKVYGTGTVNSELTGVTPRTFRKWSWAFVRLMAHMKSVSISSTIFSTVIYL